MNYEIKTLEEWDKVRSKVKLFYDEKAEEITSINELSKPKIYELIERIKKA